MGSPCGKREGVRALSSYLIKGVHDELHFDSYLSYGNKGNHQTG
jgi:hypothetical protein